MCRLSLNLGSSTSWNPQGQSRPVQELLYLYLVFETYSDGLTIILQISIERRVEFLGAFANLRLAIFMSVRLSFCQHGTTRPPLQGYSWNFIFEYFSKICPENSIFEWVRAVLLVYPLFLNKKILSLSNPTNKIHRRFQQLLVTIQN
jgi:hypothetical protein